MSLSPAAGNELTRMTKVNHVVELRFDRNEHWTLRKAKAPEGRTGIQYQAVLLHMVGQALGLAKSSKKGQRMSPFYRPLGANEMASLTSDDTTQLMKIYIQA